MSAAERLTGHAGWRLFAPLAVMAAIFLGSSQPMPIDVPSGGDKLLHVGAYALLAGAWGWALAPRYSRVTQALAAATLSGLYGASDEWHQSFVPGRDASLTDWLADLVGASLGAVVSWRRRASRPV